METDAFRLRRNGSRPIQDGEMEADPFRMRKWKQTHLDWDYHKADCQEQTHLDCGNGNTQLDCREMEAAALIPGK